MLAFICSVFCSVIFKDKLIEDVVLKVNASSFTNLMEPAHLNCLLRYPKGNTTLCEISVLNYFWKAEETCVHKGTQRN